MATAQAPPTWFSRSKTRAPRFSILLVERRRLLSALDAALDKPLSCIVAPAGFGKSTLLAQWRDSLIDRDIPCAWINLDENDREIRQFFAYLIFAFEDAGISLGPLRQAAENGFVDMSSSSIVTNLLAAIGEIDKRAVLVLDDYHRPASEEIDDFVKVLSDQFGDRLHIAIGSRKPVEINLPTMLVAGRAIEIPSFDLRFSDCEVREAMDTDLDQEAIDDLQAEVEGWPVAVQMTRLLGNKDRIDVRSRRHIMGSQGHVADYLVANVLRSQPDTVQDFLLATSILESFNVALADAVCGHNKSQSLIRQLEPLQALVVPLDDDFEWFRYHHLFSECLSDLLKHEDHDRFVELHRRAAKWCGENRLIAEAVDYANAIEDYDLSRQIINENCEWMRRQNFGGVGYLNGLLANISEEEIARDPRILFSKGFASMLSGNLRTAVHYHNMAEAIIERNGITPETFRDRLGIGSAILARSWFEVERGGGWLNERLETAEELAKANPNVRYLCASLKTSLAGQNVFYGNFDKARTQALAAETDVQQIMAGVVGIYIQVTLGAIELWANELDEARRRFREASGRAVDFGGDQSDLTFICEAYVKAIDYWQSDIDSDPPLELEHALMRIVEAEGWFDIFSIGFDATVHNAICRQDFGTAEAHIEKLEKATERLLIPRLAQLAQLLRLDCALALHDLARAELLLEEIQDWLDVDGKALDDLGWFVRITAAYSRAGYLGAVGRYDEALAHIEKGLAEAGALDIDLFRVRGKLLKTSLLERAQRPGEAVEVLTHAIEDAARTGCLRPFARDVPSNLVREAADRARGSTKNPIVDDFADKLCSSYGKELFTVREQDVLQGLADGKANKEIARDLKLTDNTVKFHVRNIYRKLDVTKRVRAVEKARELGVVP